MTASRIYSSARRRAVGWALGGLSLQSKRRGNGLDFGTLGVIRDGREEDTLEPAHDMGLDGLRGGVCVCHEYLLEDLRGQSARGGEAGCL